jgi:RNA-directed DNA polymerase
MYYRSVASKRIFATCDYHLMATLKHWAGRRHGHKSPRWVFRKYWHRNSKAGGRLEFSTPDPDGLRLVQHADMPIRRHVKVRGKASPYDGNLVYWAQRLRDHPLTSSRVALLLKRQGGRCARCGLLFTDADRDSIEVDHVIPRSLGGAHDPTNMQALHGHCHDEKTAEDGSQSKRRRSIASGVIDKDHVAEEPDEANASRPVLQTSRSREGAA